MDPELLLLVAFFVLLALFFFYMGFVVPASRLRYSTQTGFVFLAAFLIPFCLLVLADQSRAAGRLTALGIVPHPSIRNAIGVATGGGAGPVAWLLSRWNSRGPTWVFDVSASPAEILAFYRRETNAPGWVLVEDDSPVMLVLRRGTQTLTIAPHETATSRQVRYVIRQKS